VSFGLHPNDDDHLQKGTTPLQKLYLVGDYTIVFTGMIDEFSNYSLGELEYRRLKFETEAVDVGNYQGNAVVNYTDSEVPYTRIIEHKHFEFGKEDKN